MLKLNIQIFFLEFKLEFSALGSGSGGNAYLIKEGDTIILIDIGFSLREIIKRLEKLSINLNSISAILITHEHWDHIKGLENFIKNFPKPVFLSQGTLKSLKFELKTDINIISGGKDFQIGRINISHFLSRTMLQNQWVFPFQMETKKLVLHQTLERSQFWLWKS